MPIQNKPPNPKTTSRTSADVIHYGKVFRPYGPEWVENGLTSHVPIPTIIELIHQNIPAKRNTDLTSLKKTALVSILMKFYDKTNNTGKKRIEQWVYTHRYRRKIQFDNPFVEKINKFLNHLKTFESPKFTVTPATASKIFNELTITGITSLSEVRSVLKSNIVKSSTQEKAFTPIFNEWFSSDLSKYTNSPSRVKIIPDSLSALDPSSSQSQSSDDIESLLTEFRQIVSGTSNSEGEYIPNEASNEHTESPETTQDPNDTDDFEDEGPEDEPPEPPEKLEPKSDTFPPSPSSPDSDKEDESNSPEEDESISDSSSQSDLPEDLDEEPSEEDEKDEDFDSKSDSSENDEDPEEEPEPEEPEDDFGETSDSSDKTEPEDEDEDEDEPPQDETSNSNSETDEEKEGYGESSEDKDESEEENNDGENESEEETESDKDEEPQQDGDSESTTEPLRERPLVKQQVKDMILKIANSEDSTIDELRHHTKEQLNIT